MRRNFILGTLAALAISANAFAQTEGRVRARGEADSRASVASEKGNLDVASGTRIVAELQNSLDAGRARVGDRVVLKTKQAIKANGETVVKKGAKLFGQVADVRKKAKGSAESSVTILFDRLESGSLSAPISVTIDSITQAATRARMGGDDDDFGAGASARGRSTTSARTSGGGNSSGGGGLLGGVTGAVGNTVGGVAGATGDVVGSTTETVGGTVRGAGSTLSGIRITQSGSASAEGGSTLSLTGGNLRLEKGTTFHLTVTESARVGN